MADSDNQPSAGQRFTDALPALMAAAGTGLADLAMTGIPSAGTLAPAVELTLQIARDARSRRHKRGSQVVEVAAAQIGGHDRLEALATSSDARLELTARTIEAAMRTTLANKIRALGQVLANGLDGHATVDQGRILTSALDHLEAPHIQVLAAIRDHVQAHQGFVDRSKQAEATTLTNSQLGEQLPGHVVVLGALLQVLYGQHRIEPVSGGLTFQSRGAPTRWGITELGELCLTLVQSTEEANPHPIPDI
jgi:hypothetical protein